MLPPQTEEQAQPEAPQGPQGPPGQKENFSQLIKDGGTTMSDEDILMYAAELAWKVQQQEQLEPQDEAFIEMFFPEGIPPELAQFSPQAKEQGEAVETGIQQEQAQPMAQPQAQPAPQGQPLPQAQGPPGAY